MIPDVAMCSDLAACVGALAAKWCSGSQRAQARSSPERCDLAQFVRARRLLAPPADVPHLLAAEGAHPGM